jgi:4-amino-4-deoxy-L-arabinose transferase-like glycosyltransferase
MLHRLILSENEPQEATAAGDRRRSTPPRVWLGLLVVILIFMTLATIIAVKTPAYESADEPGHVQNIETLLGGHWYGMNTPCRLNPHIGLLQCSGDEANQAPLYYLLFAGWQLVIGQPLQPPFNSLHVTVNPDFFRGTSGLFSHHSFANYRFLLWLRLPNVILGALTVLLTFFAVRLVTTDEWTPLVAASFVAFLPRMIFLTAFVTNDNLVNLLGAGLTFVALRFALAPSRWRMAAVGTMFGLLLTTKLTTLPLVVVIGVLALFAPGWKRRVEYFCLGVISTLIVSGWYLIQNTVRYGDPLARGVSAHYLSLLGALGTPIGQPYLVRDPLRMIIVQVPQRVVQTFWYVSDWNQFHWSWEVNSLFTFVFACTLLGLIHRRVNRRVLVTLCVISVAAMFSVWLVAFQTFYQAKYAFVGISALAGLVALGVERWKQPARFLLPAMGLIGTLVAIQIDVLALHWN